MLAHALKERLAKGELTLGPMLTYDFWPGYIEIFKQLGYHFVFVDCEHGAATTREIEELCRVARLVDLPVLLRVESAVYHLIRKWLDMGPAGLIVPWVEEMTQVETLREGAYLAPKGRRGPGGPGNFWAANFFRDGWDAVERDLCLVVQFETPKGVERAAELAAPDWVHAGLIGPYDLSMNLGRLCQMDDPLVVASIERALAGCRRSGKPCGMVIATPEQAKFWMDRGFRFLVTGEVSGWVRQHGAWLKDQIEKLQSSPGATRTTGRRALPGE